MSEQREQLPDPNNLVPLSEAARVPDLLGADFLVLEVERREAVQRLLGLIDGSRRFNPERARRLLVLRHGLDGREPMTYREIAAALGLCAARVRQIEHQVYRKLRRILWHNKRLRHHLELQFDIPHVEYEYDLDWLYTRQLNYWGGAPTWGAGLPGVSRPEVYDEAEKQEIEAIVKAAAPGDEA